MHDEQRRAWARFRGRAIKVSIGVVIFSGIGLWLIYQWQPVATGSNKGNLSPHVFGVLQTFLTTLLSIGGISLLFEVLLRESYGADLRRFLNLKEAVAVSGIQHVGNETSVDWAELLPRANDVRAIIRDPSHWLQANLPHLIVAAQRHAITIEIGLPNISGGKFGEVAGSIGVPEDQLRENIRTAVDTAKNQWRANELRIKKDSSIRLVQYDELALYDVIAVEDHTFVGLSRPVVHSRGDYSLYIEFAQDSPGYPSLWLRESYEVLKGQNEYWAGGNNRKVQP